MPYLLGTWSPFIHLGCGATVLIKNLPLIYLLAANLPIIPPVAPLDPLFPRKRPRSCSLLATMLIAEVKKQL